MILYNRKKVKYRKDGYCWKKRKDGKTTREDHMKLKVQGVEVGRLCCFKTLCLDCHGSPFPFFFPHSSFSQLLLRQPLLRLRQRCAAFPCAQLNRRFTCFLGLLSFLAQKPGKTFRPNPGISGPAPGKLQSVQVFFSRIAVQFRPIIKA